MPLPRWWLLSSTLRLPVICSLVLMVCQLQLRDVLMPLTATQVSITKVALVRETICLALVIWIMDLALARALIMTARVWITIWTMVKVVRAPQVAQSILAMVLMALAMDMTEQEERQEPVQEDHQ